ncbi:MAG: hypothetical protein ACLSHE_04480 [Roseburia sp.]
MKKGKSRHKRKKSRLLWIAIAVIGMAAVISAVCVAGMLETKENAWRTPEELLVEYMYHIPKKEYEEMYAMLHVEASGSISQEDFIKRNGANGNSRVILNENEEIIEYLVYDRLSENEKCELYVLYRSKKNTDGSWYILEAEILDIFAYSMSTKDVVSSGKTSWSATGSEEHEIN